MSNFDERNRLKAQNQSGLHDLESCEKPDYPLFSVKPTNNQTGPPPVPRRAKLLIKQQNYAERGQDNKVPTPEPRQRSNLNANELEAKFNHRDVRNSKQSLDVDAMFPRSFSRNHGRYDVETDDKIKSEGLVERVHEIILTDQDDDDEDEIIDHDADENYRDEDDGYDDSGLHSGDHFKADEGLVDLSRRSMVPLDEVIAYYEYIKQNSDSIENRDEHDFTSNTKERQSSTNQQRTKIADLNSRQTNVRHHKIEYEPSFERELPAKHGSGHDESSVACRRVPLVYDENVDAETGATETNDAELKHSQLELTKKKEADRRRVRAKVVLELINSERDFVKHLRDVVEGYLHRAKKHPEIFTGERINTIFANIEQLYEFQRKFLDNLEPCIDWKDLAASQVGKCFLDHEKDFSVYHYYCNNHPNATSELQELYTKPRFVKFFEACRLLQNMIDISLDGFLLTPIQKICKYPLQLTELLKHTEETHPDYQHVINALETMRNCANLANERKRRIEALADVMSFQEKVENWFGPKLSDTSSTLIHSAEVLKMNASNAWSQGVQLYLFDHLLLYMKRDILLKRSSLVLKGRICMDAVTEISDADEYKPKRSFKLFCGEQQKWFVFITRTEKEKDEWIQAFERERALVESDESEGFQITSKEIGIARRALQHRKHNRSARYRHKRPDTAIVDQIDLDDANMIMNRTLSLPSCIHPSHVMNFVEDSKVLPRSSIKSTGTGAATQQSSHSSGPRSPSERVSLQHQHHQHQASSPSDDQHPDQRSQVSGVNWFKKMGSKKLAKSQVYTISDCNQSSGQPNQKLNFSSALATATPNQPAQLTAAQAITSDKAAIKYEELEKRHRDHMSSEEQARLYRLNNDLPPPPSMFSYNPTGGRPETSLSSRRLAGNSSAIQHRNSNSSRRSHPDTPASPCDSMERHRPKIPPQSPGASEQSQADNGKLSNTSGASSSFEATLVLSSGRVVRVREDAV